MREHQQYLEQPYFYDEDRACNFTGEVSVKVFGLVLDLSVEEGQVTDFSVLGMDDWPYAHEVARDALEATDRSTTALDNGELTEKEIIEIIVGFKIEHTSDLNDEPDVREAIEQADLDQKSGC